MARRKDHTREELIKLAVDCGLKIVAAQGIQALTARKVAEKMGYTPGTLYNLFENIDALAAAINCVTLKNFAEKIADIRARSTTAPKKLLERICYAYIQLQQDSPNLWTLLFATPLSNKSDSYTQATHSVFDQVVDTISPLCPSRKTARRDAKIIWATLHGICLLEQSRKLNVTEPDSPETLIKRFLNQFLTR
jgi:AcrR family transcriptional regulator